MRSLKAARASWLGLMLAAYGVSVSAAVLEGQLENGTRVEVDTDNYRAVVVDEGGTKTPLWDGVHTLKNGSTLRIQSGIVIPDRSVVEAPERRVGADLTPRSAAKDTAMILCYCERLVEKVCGEQGQCNGTSGCDAAKQLLTMERDERGRTTSPVAMTPSGHSCDEALSDEAFFPRCTR